MKYYLHDTNAFNDEKITELFINYGYEGLGLFYTLLEKIAFQEKPVKTKVLKSQLQVGKRLEKCWSFMEEVGLIQSNNGETFNKQLLNYSENYQIKKEKNAKRISEWRRNKLDMENVTCYESVSNTPKVKESKININRKEIKRFNPPSINEISSYISENNLNIDGQYFIDFYTSNGWKVGKNPMKDWKATARNWHNRIKEEKIAYRHPATEIINKDIKEQIKRF